jgi:hypothetical protein
MDWNVVVAAAAAAAVDDDDAVFGLKRKSLFEQERERDKLDVNNDEKLQ